MQLQDLDKIAHDLEAEGRKETPNSRLARIKVCFYGHSVLSGIHEKRDLQNDMAKKIEELENVVVRLQEHLQQMPQMHGGVGVQ